MERSEIIDAVDRHLRKVLPGVTEPLDLSKSFKDYGAKSIDIVEIVAGVMRELRIKVPRTALSELHNIGEMVNKFDQFANEPEKFANEQ